MRRWLGWLGWAAAAPAMADQGPVPSPGIEHAPLLLTDLGALFGPDRYPPSAMRAGEQGRVVARFTVGADGSVSACTVTQSSGSAALDAQTCSSWALARFAPAHDAQGAAAAIVLFRAVRWVLPADAPVGGVAPPTPLGAPVLGRYPPAALRRGEQGRTVARLAIAADGTVTACSVLQSSGSAILDAESCRVAFTQVRYTPARDAAGVAVAGEALLPVKWVLPPAELARRCAAAGKRHERLPACSGR